MKPVISRVILFIIMLIASAEGYAMPDSSPAQTLRAMIGQDHFLAQEGGLYIGILDPSLKADLNSKVDAAAVALANAAEAETSRPQLLAILKKHISGIDRDSLDTEDAEHVAELFEQMLDALSIERSDGILNDWMYGFDPT